MLSKLVSSHHKVLVHWKLKAPNELMPSDKDFGCVRVTRGLTCERYGDLHDIIPETNMCNHVRNHS